MKKQVKLFEALGKTIQTVVEGHSDVIIVFTDDTFAFLHPVRDYDDTTIDEPDYLKDPSNWYIGTDAAVAAGVLTHSEADEKKRLRQVEWETRQERQEREQLARLQAKYDRS